MSEQLSERELQVLQSVADGNTLLDTARSLKLAHITVRKYATEIREKLKADTTPNAVAIAIRRGLID